MGLLCYLCHLFYVCSFRFFLLVDPHVLPSKARLINVRLPWLFVQVVALHAFIGTLLNCNFLALEDYEALVTKIAQYSNKLLKKADQSKLVRPLFHVFD